MIRINLLPVRQVRKVQAGRRQLMMLLVLVVVEVAAMVVLYMMQSSEVDAKRRKQQALQAEIEQLKREVGDYELLRVQRDRLIAQRNIINALQASRTGPVWWMREVSDILSSGKGPTVDQTAYEELLRRDPKAGFNLRWNSRRLWIEALNERGTWMGIAGKAKDYDDVAELLKRFTLSQYFHTVQLRRNDLVFDQGVGLRVVRFSMTAGVKY